VSVNVRLCPASQRISGMAQMVINKRRVSRFRETSDPCIVQVWRVDRQLALRLCPGCSSVARLSYCWKETKELVKDRVISKR
jgi:hypothetical protein